MAFKPQYGTLAKVTFALDIREQYEKSVGKSFNNTGYSYDSETAWQDGVVKACAYRNFAVLNPGCTMLARRIKREVVEQIPKIAMPGDSFRRDKDAVWRLILTILEEEANDMTTTKTNKYGLTEEQVEEITQKAIRTYERLDQSKMCSDGRTKATEAVKEALFGGNKIKQVDVTIVIAMEDGTKIHVSGPDSCAWNYVEAGSLVRFTGNGAATADLWIESLGKAITKTCKDYDTSKDRIRQALDV